MHGNIGQLPRRDVAGQLTELPKIGPHVFRISQKGGITIRPRRSSVSRRATCPAKPTTSAARTPALEVSSPRFTSISTGKRGPARLGGLRQLLRQAQRIHRMHPLEQFPCRPRLVGLEMPHQVPGYVQVRQGRPLRLRFLNAVLAKIPQSGFVGRANELRRVRLGDGHQSYVPTPATAAPGRQRRCAFPLPRCFLECVRPSPPTGSGVAGATRRYFASRDNKDVSFYHSLALYA